jgi:hypothetical protein
MTLTLHLKIAKFLFEIKVNFKNDPEKWISLPLDIEKALRAGVIGEHVRLLLSSHLSPMQTKSVVST